MIRTKIWVIFLLLPLLAWSGIHSIDESENMSDHQDSTAIKTEQITRYFKSLTIGRDEIIEGPVKVVRGDLTVYGKILGDVTVLFGNVFLKDSCFIDGDVKTISGKIYLDPYAQVSGELVETGLGYYRKSQKRPGKWKVKIEIDTHRENKKQSTVPEFPFFPWQTSGGGVFGYNRVDGLILGISKNPDYEKDANIEFYGSLAYSIGRKRGLFQAGLEKILISPDTNRVTLGAEIHSFTDTYDDWRMTREFNSLSTLLLKQDYFHYFERGGYTAYAGLNLTPFFIKLSYFNDRIAPLQEKRRWSLFNQTSDYFDTMITATNTSWMRGMQIFARVGKEWIRKDKNTGMTITSRVNLIVTSSGFRSDYSFNRLLWQTHLRFLNPGRDVLDVTFTLGSAENEYPEFMYFRLGGPGTLRGIKVNSLAGNRLMLVNTEWKMPLSWIEWLGLDDEKLVLFLDSGLAWEVEHGKKLTEGFDVLRWNKLKSAGGFGIILDEDDGFQIDFGFNLNHSSPRPVTYITMSKKL